MAILNIFPTEDFDTVVISTAYADFATPARRESRDKLFAMLSHPAFRSMYEDVVYYA